jgi:hypothetical protein
MRKCVTILHDTYIHIKYSHMFYFEFKFLDVHTLNCGINAGLQLCHAQSKSLSVQRDMLFVLITSSSLLECKLLFHFLLQNWIYLMI